jgi:hypothetical protein
MLESAKLGHSFNPHSLLQHYRRCVSGTVAQASSCSGVALDFVRWGVCGLLWVPAMAPVIGGAGGHARTVRASPARAEQEENPMKWLFAIAVVAVVVLLVRKARRQGKAAGEPAHGGYIASDSGSARSKETCSSEGAGSDCGGGDGGGGGGD